MQLFAAALAAASASSSELPACNVNGSWAGACIWPSRPPSDCPFAASTDILNVSFSGRYGAYPSSRADTWYPSPGADGRLYTSFADGDACQSAAGPAVPVPPDRVELLWWWSATDEDNVLTTAAAPPSSSNYELVGVIGYAEALAAPSVWELKLWWAQVAGRGDYFTTSGAVDEAAARAANYTLVVALGAALPQAALPPDAQPLPPTTDVNVPPGTRDWVPSYLYYSAQRNDHFSSPEPLPPGYASLRQQGYQNLQPAACASASGVSPAQGFAVLAGTDPFNLTIEAVGTVVHPPVAAAFPSVPPPYGVYPCTSFVYGGVWWYGLYLLASPSGACGNWCRLGPLLGFAVGNASAAAPGGQWTFPDAPAWNGSDASGVFERVNLTAPLRMGVPRFVDLGPDQAYSPGGDGRAYLVGKGCAANDDLHCSFMTGDAAFLARTRLPLAALAATPGALNRAESWEFSAGPGGEYVPALEQAQPLWAWPGGVGGVTLTFNPGLRKFVAVVNLPGDRVRPVDCHFDTYMLEADAIQGPYRLVSYMQSLGPQMYFQHASSAFWSADGTRGVLFSSGNWDGTCTTQGSNPPGERYGLVTTEFGLVTAAAATTN